MFYQSFSKLCSYELTCRSLVYLDDHHHGDIPKEISTLALHHLKPGRQGEHDSNPILQVLVIKTGTHVIF